MKIKLGLRLNSLPIITAKDGGGNPPPGRPVGLLLLITRP